MLLLKDNQCETERSFQWCSSSPLCWGFPLLIYSLICSVSKSKFICTHSSSASSLNPFDSLGGASFSLCSLFYAPFNCHTLTLKHLCEASLSLTNTNNETVRAQQGREELSIGGTKRRKERERSNGRWRQKRGEKVCVNIWCWQKHQGVSQRPPVNSNTVWMCVCVWVCVMSYV